MTGACCKMTVVAIIENYGRYWVGTNFCRKPQKKCPRRSLTSGSGYELCRDVCGQPYHAEEDACRSAGDLAKGGTLYLIGHIYCCDNCKKVIKKFGIKKVVIGRYPKRWKLEAPIHLISPKTKEKRILIDVPLCSLPMTKKDLRLMKQMTKEMRKENNG